MGLVLATLLAATPYVFGLLDASNGSGGDTAAVGDFDEDGHPDLVEVDFSAGAVSLLFGHAGGTFTTGPAIAVGMHPEHAVTGDFDGDHHLDLAVVNNECPDNFTPCPPGSVSILLGRGDGTFKPAVTYTVGAAPNALVAADLNRDGRLDLAVADAASRIDSGATGFVTVLLNHGDGTFTVQPTEYPAGNGVIGLAAGDFTGAGHVDLVIDNHPSLASTKLSLLVGAGDGTFAMPVGFDATGPAVALVAGDLNHDGRADLAIATTANWDPSDTRGQVAILLGKPDGTFATSTAPCGWGPESIGLADLDGDGNLDLVLGVVTRAHEPGAGAVSVLRGHADGTFDTNTDYVTGTNGAVVFGDFDGDGHLDVAQSRGGGTAMILHGNGDATLTHAAVYSTGRLPSALVLVDLDGDGRPDMVEADASCLSTPCPTSTLSVFLSGKDGAFAAPVTVATTDAPVALVAGDFDGDGHPDVIVIGVDGKASLHLGDGAGRLGAGRAFTTVATPARAVAADFDHDGHLDLAVTSPQDGTVTIHLGKGGGMFKAPVAYPAGSGALGLVAADLNHDGALDLAVADSFTPASFRDRGLVAVLLGNGDGTFQAHVDAETASLSPVDVAAGDFNGDGRTDLAVATNLREIGRLVVLLGNGDGTFAASTASAPLTGSLASRIVAADFNGDGRLDVALLDQGSTTIALLVGSGDGGFTPQATFGAGDAPSDLAAADLNGDGLADLAALGQANGTLSIYLSGCPSGVCAPAPVADGGAPNGDGSDGGVRAPPPVAAKTGCGCSGSGAAPAVLLAALAVLAGLKSRR